MRCKKISKAKLKAGKSAGQQKLRVKSMKGQNPRLQKKRQPLGQKFLRRKAGAKLIEQLKDFSPLSDDRVLIVKRALVNHLEG